MNIRALAKNEDYFSYVVSLLGVLMMFFLFVAFRFVNTNYAAVLGAGIASLLFLVMVRRVERLLWATLCLCLVINFDITIGYNGHLGGAAGIVISLYDMNLVALYFLWIVELLYKKKADFRIFPKMSVAVGILFLTVIISMLDSPFPKLGIYEFIEIFKFYLTFLYIANRLKTRDDVRFIVFFLIFGLFLEGVLGLLQHRYDDPLISPLLGAPSYLRNSRITGNWMSYNDFSWYLTFFIPLAYAAMLVKSYNFITKAFFGVTFLLGSASLIWTNSRGGWLSLAVAMLFLISQFSKNVKGKKALIRMFFLILIALSLASPIYPRIFSKVYTRFTADDNGSAESRLPQFEVAGNIIRDNPINGIGLNTYTEIMYYYDTTVEGLDSITQFPVHNIYLHMFAELGIIGAIGFIFFISRIFWIGLNTVGRTMDEYGYYIIAFLGGIIAFLVHGVADTCSLGNKLFLFVWLFAGIIIAIDKIKNEKNLPSTIRRL